MTLQQLQYFRVMANTLHYTKAATILHISQPSLSYALAQLESELGVALFKKVGKQVFLTAVGIQFKETADTVLDELDSGIAKVRLISKSAKQDIKLGYVQSLSSTLIPNIIEKFYKELPSNTVQFIFSSNQQYNLISSLKNDSLDIVFSTQPVEGLNCKMLAMQELVLIVHRSHPFCAMQTISLAELSGQPIIMLQSKTGLYKTIQDMFREHGLSLNIAQEACDFNAAVNYVSFNKGLSILPSNIVIENQSVSIVKIRDYNIARPIYALWKDDVKKNVHKMEFVNFLDSSYGLRSS